MRSFCRKLSFGGILKRYNTLGYNVAASSVRCSTFCTGLDKEMGTATGQAKQADYDGVALKEKLNETMKKLNVDESIAIQIERIVVDFVITGHLSQLRKEIFELKQESEISKQRIGTLEKENEELKEKVGNLEQENKTFKDTFSTIEPLMARLSKEFFQLVIRDLMTIQGYLFAIYFSLRANKLFWNPHETVHGDVFLCVCVCVLIYNRILQKFLEISVDNS